MLLMNSHNLCICGEIGSILLRNTNRIGFSVCIHSTFTNHLSLEFFSFCQFSLRLVVLITIENLIYTRNIHA